ncbi:hypothetical protein [Spirosoma pulveris]
MEVKGEDIFPFFERELTIFHIKSIAGQGFDIYDDATDHLFSEIEEEIEEAEQSLESAQKELEQHIDENPDDAKDPNIQELYLYEPYSEIWSKGEQLNSLAEMKIIYLFKNLETVIKSMIKQSYPDINIKDFYRADNLAGAVTTFGIILPDINGYAEYNELRRVNNNIKHSKEISDDTKKIPEFKKDYEFNSGSIIKFYNRVRSKVLLFSEGFAEALVNSAFFFSEDRLKEISKSYLNRMDQETANKFSEMFAHELRERYTVKPKA